LLMAEWWSSMLNQ